MAKSAILSIKILTDATQAKTGLDKTSTAVGKMQAGIRKAAVPAGIALAAVVAFGKGSLDAASNVQQAMGAVDSVFGDSAAQIKAWSDQSAKSVGLSKSTYGELASVIGAQLKNMGVPMDEVAGKTNDLITMGADLAATYGGTTQQAVEALGSALRGETDPIERYGISIKQADIAAQQAKDGTTKLTGAAAKQAKTTALLGLVTKQAGGAVGQFGRETDSAAGSSQVATAQWEDAQAALGEALLPAAAAVSGVLASMAGFLTQNAGATRVLIIVVAALAVAVLAANAAITIYETAVKVAAAVQWAWNAAMSANPIGLIILAVVALVAVFVLLWKRSDTVRRVITSAWAAIRSAAVVAWNAIKGTVLGVINWIKANWKILLVALTGPLGAAVVLVVSNWAKIKAAAKAAIDWIKSAWSTLWNGLKSAASAAATALAHPFDVVKEAADKVIQAIRDVIDWLKKIHVPKINLPGPLGGKSAPAPAATTPSVAGVGAGGFTAARVARPSATRATGAGGTTVIIQGAVDPESTARQVRRILDRHDARVGLTGVLRTS